MQVQNFKLTILSRIVLFHGLPFFTNNKQRVIKMLRQKQRGESLEIQIHVTRRI